MSADVPFRGVQRADMSAVFLTYRPDLEGWKTTNDIEPHQKVITPS